MGQEVRINCFVLVSMHLTYCISYYTEGDLRVFKDTAFSHNMAMNTPQSLYLVLNRRNSLPYTGGKKLSAELIEKCRSLIQSAKEYLRLILT